MKELQHEIFLGSKFDMLGFCNKFRSTIIDMGIQQNDGGLHIQGLFNLAIALTRISPTCLVELGVFKGLSSAFAKNFFQENLKIYCFDPRVEDWEKLIPFKRQDIEYCASDFATPVMAKLDGLVDGRVCCFADDHQDVFERLLICSARNFEWIIFDDDYTSRADHRSFYMLLQQAEEDCRLSAVLSLLIDSYLTLPDLNSWKKSFPECESIMDLDQTGHYRRCTIVKLANRFPSGWTAGNITGLNRGVFSQEVYKAI